MIKQHFSKDKKNEVLFLFSGLILLKLLVFHSFIGIERNYIAISVLNTFTVMAILIMTSLLKTVNRFKTFLIINIIISFLFFANSLYFRHFGTVLPIHIIYQIRHLRGVGGSIYSILRLQYLLFFIDIVPLMWYFNRKYKGRSTLSTRPRHALTLLMAFVMVFTSVFGHFMLKRTDDVILTPYNLGVINYHIYDILKAFRNETIPAGFANVIEEVIIEETDLYEREYTGLIAGRNIIVIQAESLQAFVINEDINGQPITPVLNQLIKEDSFYFSQYYEQVGWGNTSDAEFVSHNGLHSSLKNYSYKSYEGKNLISLPNVLKEEGYSTIVFHGNEPEFWNRRTMYPYMGFDTFISTEDLIEDEVIGMGLSDKSLFKQAIPYLSAIDQPFYSFFITLTSHYPFLMEEDHKTLFVPEPYQDTIFGDYIHTVNYLDRSIGELINDLKEAGLYENSVIVIYGDHHGLKTQDEETLALLEDFLDKELRVDEMLMVPLIIHVPDGDINEEITIAGGMIDFFPTMANLLNITIENTHQMGKDLLNNKEGFVATFIHTAMGSFIDNDKVFIMSKDGVFENSSGWNKLTGEEMDLEDFRAGYQRALVEIYLSEFILENDLLPLVGPLDILKILEERE
ncbi:LTA synthase family protein [Alkaliphilus peptidifermentans]|uniref:Phosphoglycerol transferase MdoB n=1 Tax=Alkaliphilus peptidifermentans DSM 18978 TaxID=1120976 RepID=A0A1G5ACI3_9FIRM|nr:LTA synthase family protein [Alkaliphilus peptidifermentans]SCX75569.1 Phosphoglycerol transferase MdoB [Alkaliphilus peptidifermentans DSM 18978]